MSDLSRIKFFWRAIWTDIKQSRRWKIVSISYTLIGVLRLVLWIVTKRSPADLIAPWSGKATAIFILAFVCLGVVLALIAVVDGARRVHLQEVAPLNETIESQRWLVKIENQDRYAVGQGVRIIGCEVDIDISSGRDRGWLEFRFKVFNGSVFPITLAGVTGVVSFSNMSEFRELDGSFKVIPYLSVENWQRHTTALFTLHHELSKADAGFISAAKSGCFMFDKLAITVRGQGEAFDDLPVALIPTQVDDVQPTLRSAFRHDASFLESERRTLYQSHLERVRLLSEVIGRGRELVRIHKDPQFIPMEDMKAFGREIERALRECYGNSANKKFYPFEFKEDKMEGPEDYSQGRVDWFIQYLNRLVIVEEQEESESG